MVYQSSIMFLLPFTQGAYELFKLLAGFHHVPQEFYFLEVILLVPTNCVDLFEVFITFSFLSLFCFFILCLYLRFLWFSFFFLDFFLKFSVLCRFV
jgi:hypothetical protein